MLDFSADLIGRDLPVVAWHVECGGECRNAAADGVGDSWREGEAQHAEERQNSHTAFGP